MTFRGYKQVSYKSIVMDVAEIRRRSKAAHVADLAGNIRENGDDLIHAPLVRAGSMALICGRDRMAALLVLKAKRLWVHLVDCTDKQSKSLELSENVYRRPSENRSELLAELVAMKGQELRAAIGDTVPDRDGASDKQIKAEARKQVARAAGIKPASLKKAEQRAKAAKVPPSEDADTSVAAAKGEDGAPDAEPYTLDLLGLEDASARAVMKYARRDQEAIDKADKLMQLAQAALAGMTPGTVQQQLHADVHRVAARVRSHRPDFICPWCKGLPKGEVGACTPCGGLGYVSHEIAGRAPRELRDGPTLVAIDGVFIPYMDVKAGKLPAKNGAPKKKAGKSISAVDAQGNDLPLDADEAY